MDRADVGSLEWLGPKEARGTDKLVFPESGGHKDTLSPGDESSLDSIPWRGPDRGRGLFQVRQGAWLAPGHTARSGRAGNSLPPSRPGLDYVARLGFGEEF